MPAVSVDTSALVKRYVPEVGSAWVRRTLARPTLLVLSTSALAQPEDLQPRCGGNAGGRGGAEGLVARLPGTAIMESLSHAFCVG